MESTILVIGATGNIGKELTKLLTDKGCKVRVTIRPSSHTEELKALGVEMIHADLLVPSSLKEAMKSIEKVVFATPFVPNMVELSSHIIQAAKEAGVKHLVRLQEIPEC